MAKNMMVTLMTMMVTMMTMMSTSGALFNLLMKWIASMSFDLSPTANLYDDDDDDDDDKGDVDDKYEINLLPPPLLLLLALSRSSPSFESSTHLLVR